MPNLRSDAPKPQCLGGAGHPQEVWRGTKRREQNQSNHGHSMPYNNKFGNKMREAGIEEISHLLLWNQLVIGLRMGGWWVIASAALFSFSVVLLPLHLLNNIWSWLKFFCFYFSFPLTGGGRGELSKQLCGALLPTRVNPQHAKHTCSLKMILILQDALIDETRFFFFLTCTVTQSGPRDYYSKTKSILSRHEEISLSAFILK